MGLKLLENLILDLDKYFDLEGSSLQDLEAYRS